MSKFYLKHLEKQTEIDLEVNVEQERPENVSNHSFMVGYGLLGRRGFDAGRRGRPLLKADCSSQRGCSQTDVSPCSQQLAGKTENLRNSPRTVTREL